MELPPIPDGLLGEGGGGEGVKKEGWDKAIIRVQEQDVGQIPEILSSLLVVRKKKG